MPNDSNPIEALIATFDRMLEVCYFALSPTATPQQKQEARDMLRDWRNRQSARNQQPPKQ